MKYFFDKKGFLIEYKDDSKRLIISLALRVLIFSFDYTLPLLITYFIWYFVKENTIIKAILVTIIPYFIFFAYNFIFYKLFRRSMGMIFGSLYLSDRSGFEASNIQLFTRAIAIGIYSIPIVGWVLIIMNIFFTLFKKGVTPIDYLTKTVVVSKYLYKKINLEGEKNERYL